jgi:hypothetical protein
MKRSSQPQMRLSSTCLAIGLMTALAVAAERQGRPERADGPRRPPFWTYEDFLNKKTPQTYSIRKGHPRLLITPENRQEIIEKIKVAPGLWQRTIQQAEQGEDWQHLMACGAIYQLGLVPGFKYSMGREEYGRKGVAALMALGLPVGGHQVNFRYIAVPCGYDWLFDLLTAEQKRQIAARLVSEVRAHMGSKRAVPYALPQPNCPAGQAMIFGLAFHGDGVDDAAAKEIVEGVWKNVWWNPSGTGRPATPLQIIRYLEDGVNSEGLNYFPYHVGFPAHLACWKTATGQDYFAHLGYFRNLPYWTTHVLMPGNDGKLRYVVPFHPYTHGGGSWHRGLNANVAAATGYLRDVDPDAAALAQWWIQHQRIGHIENVEFPLLHGLLLGDPRVTAKSPSQLKLPLTFILRGLNHVHMRSGYWDDADATVVGFSNNRYLCYRCDAHNHFYLCKNGAPLFLYRGNVATHNYYREDMVPFNSVAFYRGTTAIVPPHVSSLPAAEDAARYECGTLAVDSVAGEYDYVVGEAGRSYGSRKQKEVKAAWRTLVYLRPASRGGQDYLLVLDRTQTTSPDVVPHVVFNTIFEPKVGRSWDRQDKGRVVHEGQWAIDGAPCVTVTMEHDYRFGPRDEVVLKAHGRAFLKALYPKHVGILKIGGPGHYMDDITGKGSDSQYLKAFAGLQPHDQIDRGGYWRFHVVPKQRGETHTLLTAIEPTDSKVAAPGALELLEGDTILGARLGQNVVLFSRDGRTLSSGSARLAAAGPAKAAAGTVRLVVGDLEPGKTYTLSVASDRPGLKLKAGPAGTIFARDVQVSAGDQMAIVREDR